MTLLDDLTVGLFVPNAGTVNQIRNPSGANGTTSGWEEVGTLDLTASSTSGGPLDHGVVGAKFIGATTVSGGPLGKAQTIIYPCVENDYVAVRYEVPYVDGRYKVGFQFVDEFGNDYGAAIMSGYRLAGAATSFGAQLANIGSAIAGVRVVFEHYSTTGGVPATAGQELIFRDVKLGVAATAVAALAVVDRGVWRDDLKGPHSSIKITRRPMQLATVAASLKPDQLPVGVDPVVKPGVAYRLKIGANQLGEFELTERDSEDSTTKPIPLTTLEGADAGRALALRKESRVTEVTFGIPPLAPLWEAFSDSDIPWRINGSAATGQGLEGEGAGVNLNMTAIDQIVLARDMNAPAYAWVDRLGRGNVADLAHLSAVPAAVLTEAHYSQLVTGFDMDSCFNIVTVKRIAGGEVETGSGIDELTYTDYASVEEWGEQPVTVKITNTSNAYDTVAQQLLDLNKDPVFQVLTVRIPLHKINNLAIALLDLYDLVTVQNTAMGIDQDLRVTFIEHEIKPLRSGSKWIMTLGFSVEGIAAIPQVLPEPPS